MLKKTVLNEPQNVDMENKNHGKMLGMILPPLTIILKSWSSLKKEGLQCVIWLFLFAKKKTQKYIIP